MPLPIDLNCKEQVPIILEAGLTCTDSEAVQMRFEDVKPVTGFDEIPARVFLQKSGYDAWSTFLEQYLPFGPRNSETII